jgi:hypothetical protein
MSETLLPCPFCGSEAHTPTMHSNGVPVPRCRNPECLAEAPDAAAWNRRTRGPATAKMVAALGAMQRAGVSVPLHMNAIAAFLAEHEPAQPE